MQILCLEVRNSGSYLYQTQIVTKGTQHNITNMIIIAKTEETTVQMGF